MIKLVTYNKNIDRFIKDLQRRCKKYNVICLICCLEYV